MSSHTKTKLPKLKTIKTENKIITETDMRHIEELKKKGYTFKELDKAYSRSYGTLSRYIRSFKRTGTLPKQTIQSKQPEEFDHGKLGALIKAGWRMKDLMVEFSADEEEIKKRIKEWQKLEKSKNGNSTERR